MLLRTAQGGDIPAITGLIQKSARGLGTQCYTPEQIEEALKGAWGVDSQLITDGTYFVIEDTGNLTACGGWSKRATLFGSDHALERSPELLNPERDAARIRAFFVHPEWARRGLATLLLQHCEKEIKAAGFRSAELAATLPGKPFYAARGYTARTPIVYPLLNGGGIEFVPMRKEFNPS